MRSLSRALRSILVSSLASAACAADEGVDTSGLAPIACAPADEPLVGVTSAVPADYVEVRSQGDGSSQVRSSSRGTRCATAVDRATCEADYAAVAIADGDGSLFGQVVQVREREIVIVTDASGLKVLRTKDAVKSWLSPVDTPEDAVVAATLAGYTTRCGDAERGGVGESGEGYRVLATRLTKICAPVETTAYLLAVDRAGDVRVLESSVTSREEGLCIGRRPEGLVRYRSDARSVVGRWLAEVAYLEAASVASFDRVANELDAFGAPARLSERARRARRDEVRHAKAMGRLAELHGASVARLVPTAFDERDLEAFARENAVEGCVFETFGALVGLAQAERAGDPEIRRVLTAIARDEIRHGELAWDIDAWAMSVLDASAVARVRAARSEAARALVEDHVDTLDPVSARRLGVPTGPRRRALAERFVGELEALERAARAA